MLSIFKNNNRKASKPGSLIRSTFGISYGDGVDILPTLVTSPRGRTRKLRKTPRPISTTGRFDSSSTIISISSTSVGPNSSTSYPHRSPIGIPDLVLQPDHYAALLLQASPNHDLNEPTSTASGTGRHSREFEISLEIPPSTPLGFSQDSINVGPTIFVNEVDSEASMVETITYDAVLGSTLHNHLVMTEGTKYLDIPATRTPPNSPAAIQEGGFGSLLCVSMAIMQERM